MNSKIFIGLGLASCLLLNGSPYGLGVNSKIPDIKSTTPPIVTSSNSKDNLVTIDDINLNSLKEGEKFNIVLEQNASTGYLWSYSINNEGIELVDNKNVISNQGLYGSSSKNTWTFVSKKKGNFNLKFSYARPWEKDTAAIKTIEYAVEVK